MLTKFITSFMAAALVALSPTVEAKSPCKVIVNMSYDGGVDLVDLEKASYQYLRGWTGKCNGDRAEGFGTWDGLDKFDGSFYYEGTVENGMPHGNGTLIVRTHFYYGLKPDVFVARTGKWENGRFVYGSMSIPHVGYQDDYKFDGVMNGWNPKSGRVHDLMGRLVYEGDIEVTAGGGLLYSESAYLESLKVKAIDEENRRRRALMKTQINQDVYAGGVFGVAAAAVIVGAIFVGAGVAIVRGAATKTLLIVLLPK